MNNLEMIKTFAKLRAGYWDLLFHSTMPYNERRCYKSYFVAANDAIAKLGGTSLTVEFNRLWVLQENKNKTGRN